MQIKEEARKLGFDGCGISKAQWLEKDAVYLEHWLKQHYHAGMVYMENHVEKRTDPTKLVRDAQSVISVLMNYFPVATQTDPEAPVVSKYAYGRDYHDVLRKKLRLLMQFIDTRIAPVNGRAFVDSAPILEKAWAARAGLGWIGKNSCLISPKIGSFCFLGQIIIDLPFQTDSPLPDGCGSCTRCLDACPTRAIVAPRILDAGRCISYLTIEHKGPISEKFQGRFANRVFGCDICQDVCPWNRKTVGNQEMDFTPTTEMLSMTRKDWHSLNSGQFNRLFRYSALKRTSFDGLKRNLEFLSGNP